MSNFDPAAFLTSTVDQPLETERTLCPPGEYKMYVDDFTQEALEEIEFTYKKDGRGHSAGDKGVMHVFNCPIVIDDDAVKQKMDMDRVVVFKRMILDLDDNGQLAWGKNKNIDLGQLRHATGQNAAGPWSIGNLRGAGPFMGRVDSKSGERKDGSRFENREVGRVAPIRS